ncbi:MAG: phosphomannomutase/phosphoglucomutase [Candidatus Levybacteria bacterium]|nr:phosphomannomutase/phosphoglucomutase [Candidatus Levybacteria bacterium]
MTIDPSIFKSYDIRGTYPDKINEDISREIAKAIHLFFSKKLGKNDFTIVLSRDMRVSSPTIFEAVKEVLVKRGAHVIDLGIASTPTFYFAVSYYKYDAGIQITASHNPKEYNGIKFVMNTPQGLLKIGKPTGMDEIRELSVNGVQDIEEKEGTVTKKDGAPEDEVKNAMNLFKNPEIKKFKIVADTANAVGALYIDALSKVLPIELVRMNFELDGTFPVHQADPMQPENLVDIQKRVVEENADLGLAPDGDGDRLFIINEKGEVVPPPQIIGMISTELLKEFPGSKVVVDQKYFLTAKKIVEEHGGELVLSKTGHAYITETMTKTGAIFGGEASAHYYYKATGNAESQVMTIVGVLKILTEEGKPISAVAEEFRRSYESGEFNYEVSNAQEIMDYLKNKYNDAELSEMDGVALNYPDWRFSARSSNTEPLLRINVEGLTREKVDQETAKLKQEIESIAK